jgi:ABC-type tungstate transport system permease subunit
MLGLKYNRYKLIYNDFIIIINKNKYVTLKSTIKINFGYEQYFSEYIILYYGFKI